MRKRMGKPMGKSLAHHAAHGFDESGVVVQNSDGSLEAVSPSHHSWLLYVTLFLAVGGVVIAWLEFGRRGATKVGFVERIPSLHALFAERWYMDRFYRLILDQVVYRVFSNLCTQNDNKIIDGGIDGLSKGTVETGRMLSFLHTGMVQYKLLVIFVVMVLLALYFFF